ncbi:hypothetical protein GCM10007079_29690 [Nocardiopsis terrae]|nr:hypothetical protein GCM10007079_29690 [Nocardiopsis terrae]
MSTTDSGSGARAAPGARLRTITCFKRADTTVKEEIPAPRAKEMSPKGKVCVLGLGGPPGWPGPDHG